MSKTDIIALYCKGRGWQWNGQQCEYYSLKSDECALLKERSLIAIFEKSPRCHPDNMVIKALKRNLKNSEAKTSEKDHLSIRFILIDTLKKKELKQRASLPILKGFINKTVYGEVCQMLRKERNIPLEQSVSLEDVEGCIPSFSAPPQKQIHERVQIEQVTELLARRVEQEPLHSQQRAVYERQYQVFCQLRHLFEQGVTVTAAPSILAEQFGVNRRTIKRDLEAIKEFFQEWNVPL